MTMTWHTEIQYDQCKWTEKKKTHDFSKPLLILASFFFTINDEWRRFLTMNILLNLQIPKSLTEGAPLPHIGNNWKCEMKVEASRGSDSDFQHCNQNAYSTWMTATYIWKTNDDQTCHVLQQRMAHSSARYLNNKNGFSEPYTIHLISFRQKQKATCSSNKDTNYFKRCQYYKWCYYGTVERIHSN